MTTKQKGDIAEYRVISELLRRGFAVLRPCGDRLPYDLAIDSGGGRMCRIQVKGAFDISRCVKNGIDYSAFAVDVRQSKTNRKFFKKSKHEPTDYDLFVVWIAPRDVFYIFPAAVALSYGSRIVMVEDDDRATQRPPRAAAYRERWDIVEAMAPPQS